ncbi:MAG: DUF1642 domain-containing protein [Lactobacillus sp.]|jgi:hypothetical protein|nr:DUF1642 domain-containing protein [Lactobacillus sp.]MCI2032084.1 DUF1642 domain-containing protein [Lactobacillus sp.]
MDKEELKSKLADLLDQMYHSGSISYEGEDDGYRFGGVDFSEALSAVQRLVDSLEDGHKKPELPREVGEELDKGGIAMSLYAVKNDKDCYWDFDNQGFYSPLNNARRNTTFKLGFAEAVSQANGGHVVKLGEKPAPIVVSEAEAEMLEKAKTDFYPAISIARYTAVARDQYRLMCAYVNGWVVEKPKLYYVKVPHAEGWVYIKRSDGSIQPCREDDSYLEAARQFTAAEIERYGLQDCEKVEVSDHE